MKLMRLLGLHLRSPTIHEKEAETITHLTINMCRA